MKTTGIGSLPFHNIDASLEHSLKLDIPYLPQLPIRNPKEFMIAQSLNGLPGLSFEPGGLVSLDHVQFEKTKKPFLNKLDQELKNPTGHFLPDPEYYIAWTPFLWELGERNLKAAKIQLAGPLTCQWALKLDPSVKPELKSEIETSIFKLITARSLAMTTELISRGVKPFVFLDEPGFFIFSPKDPTHLSRLLELKLLVSVLKKQGAAVGIHCCSQTHFPSLLSLKMDYLSLDSFLSLETVFQSSDVLFKYLEEGGHLSFGVIPTGKSTGFNQSLSAKILFEQFKSTLSANHTMRQIQLLLKGALLTPACGLALHSVEESETIFQTLSEFQTLCEEWIQNENL